jgi:hypothetical protein
MARGNDPSEIRKKMKMNKSASLILLPLVLSCGQNLETSTPREAWDGYNHPALMDHRFQSSLEQLPLSGQSAVRLWADDYWASARGGIAYRWQTEEVTYSLGDARNLAGEQIAKLSPAEKWDLYLGNDNWTFTRAEWQRTRILHATPGSPAYIPGFVIPGWEGLCHGWAAASFLYEEPHAVAVNNSRGQAIPFTSSDIKALLTLAVHRSVQGGRYFLGRRCEGALTDSSCRDANAGTFHVALANELGLHQRPLIIDINSGSEVWNHPVLNYQSQLGAFEKKATAGAAPGTMYEVAVTTEIQYMVESKPHFAALGAKNSSYQKKGTYRYVLELDSGKKILGGRWLSQNHPDFLWSQVAVAVNGDLAKLSLLYQAATGKELPQGVSGSSGAVEPRTPVPPSVPTSPSRPDGCDDPRGWCFPSHPAGGGGGGGFDF